MLFPSYALPIHYKSIMATFEGMQALHRNRRNYHLGRYEMQVTSDQSKAQNLQIIRNINMKMN